jgi:D-alanyl-D-alanine carboxypeptidase
VPNEADSERRSMNMRQMMDWAVRQPEYATLPEDGDARKAKGDILNQIAKKYRNAADNLFLETPDGKLLRKRSILLQLKAQNTGAQ